MTNLTPQQDEALNKAIAEFEGLEFIEGKFVLQPDKTYRKPNYTRSLDAIVPVVRTWIKKDRHNYKLFEAWIEVQYGTCCTEIADMCESDNPALALCLAFAKAANLEGEWE